MLVQSISKYEYTSAWILCICVKLMFRLKDDSSISSLRERISVLRVCSSVTAWMGREMGRLKKVFAHYATKLGLPKPASLHCSSLCDCDTTLHADRDDSHPRTCTHTVQTVRPHSIQTFMTSFFLGWPAHLSQLLHQPLVMGGQLSQLFTLILSLGSALAVMSLQLGPQGS